MRKLLVVVAVSLVVGVAHAEDRRDVNGLSVAVPAKWKFEHKTGSDHAALTHAGPKVYCVVSLYQARAAGTDLATDFATEWKSVGGTLASLTPKPTKRTVAGRTVIEAGAQTTVNGNSVYSRVAIVGSGGQITTLVIFNPDQAAAKSYQKDVDALIGSLKFPGAAPAASPPAPTTTAAPAAAPALTKKATITIADLVGVWLWSTTSSMDYYNAISGDYVTTSASFYGEQYTIKANGAVEFSYVGRANNKTVREKDTGSVALDGDLITIKLKRSTKVFQFISYLTTSRGTAILVLVPADDGKRSAEWIG